MTEQQAEGFGAYNPEAAGHQPYNDAMAEWRNQVRAMQLAGSLPGSPEAAVAGEQEAQRLPESPTQVQEGAKQVSEGNDPEEQRMSLQGDSEGGEREVPAPVVPEPGVSEQSESEEVYDPAEHNAPEVLDHLKTVGYDEAERILDSEAAGRNRKGIINLRDDILARAHKNDEQSDSE